MFEKNRPEKTTYNYTDNDSQEQLNGENTHTIIFGKSQLAPVKSSWSVTL